MNRSFIYIRRGVAATLFAAMLAACGLPGTATTPTPGLPTVTQVAGQPTVVAQPTAIASQPTAVVVQPTRVPQPATAAPAAQPIIGFNPKAGNPGTVVSVFGSGYAPGVPVKVRLGLPQPTGEVLTSAFADNGGRWSAQLTIPDRLPSGDPIPDGDFYLVAMNDANIALASAPFDFIPNQAPAPDPAQTVRDLLNNFPSGDVTRFLVKDLRDQVAAGRPVHQLLGLAPMAWHSYEVGSPLDRPSEVLFVPVRLNYATYSEDRLFTLAVDGDRWLVNGSGLRDPEPEPQPTAIDAVGAFLRLAQNDRSMQKARFYLAGRLRQMVDNGEITDVGQVVQSRYAFSSYSIGQVLGTDGNYVLVEVTLYFDPNQADYGVRHFKVTNAPNGIWAITEVSIVEALPTPPPIEQSWPGPEWKVWSSGDFSGDGLAETVYYRPSSIQSQAAFDDANLSNNAIVAEAVIVAQEGAHGLWPMLEINNRRIQADTATLQLLEGDFVPGPAAFLLAIDPGSSTLINLLPLGPNGTQHSAPIGINWNTAEHGYRLALK
ncbi:MAG TPA: hypothetical protein VFX76_17295 [Roseiflexaceae bacterium]|nr:hypothetical protein [Roseiflexaceae bacterium]